MKSQKGFTPIIIISVVLLGIVGVYYFGTLNSKTVINNPNPTVSLLSSPVATLNPATPHPITGWKTYSKVNYKLEYPESWFVFYDQPNELFISSVDPENGGKFAGFSVKTFLNPDIKSKNDLRTYILKKYPYLDPKLFLSETIIGGNFAFKLIEDAAPENISRIQNFIMYRDTIYQIETSEDLGFPERKEKELNDQILSTFEFTQ